MDYYQFPPSNYKCTLQKGRFYYAPFPYHRKEKIIVRPKLDITDDEGKIAGDLFLESESNTKLFEHNKNYSNLKLKSDEEFIVSKIKRRPVLLVNEKKGMQKANVIPVKSITDYHIRNDSIENLKENQDSFDLFYLPANNEDIGFQMTESLLAIHEMKPIFKRGLEPLNLALKDEVIEIIDEKIVHSLELFDFEEDSSTFVE